MFVIRLPKRSTRRTCAVDTAVVERWLRNVEAMNGAGGTAEGGELDALRQPCGGRRKPIASFERPADGRPRVLPLGQLDDALRGMLVKHHRQHAVVRRDELVVAGVGGDAAARRADAGIDDDEKDGAGGKVAVRRRRARARRPARRAAGTSCVMSTSVASGQMPSATPFIVPA